ncbi:MAG: hypothetical protein V3T18_05725 [Pseudomonadales bacterium]
MAQFFIDQIEHGRRLGDDGVFTQNAEQMTAGSAQLAVQPADRRRAITVWKVVVEKLANSYLIELLE